MARQATNKLLQKAKKSKSDEFYTQLCDIESELQHYANCFVDKVVYCNCDDPKVSNFFRYFKHNCAVGFPLSAKTLCLTYSICSSMSRM